MPYLVVKTAANANKSYTLTDTCNKPRLAVKLSNGSTSYVALSQTNTTGVNVKGTDGNTYALVDKKDTTYYYSVSTTTQTSITNSDYKLYYRLSTSSSCSRSSRYTGGTSYRVIGAFSLSRTSIFSGVSYTATYSTITTEITNSLLISTNWYFYEEGTFNDVTFSHNALNLRSLNTTSKYSSISGIASLYSSSSTSYNASRATQRYTRWSYSWIKDYTYSILTNDVYSYARSGTYTTSSTSNIYNDLTSTNETRIGVLVSSTYSA